MKSILIILVLFTLAVPACCGTIGETKKLPDGPSGTVTGVVTSAKPGECYIESADRASGIWVTADTADVSVGDEVVMSGQLSTVNGERLLTTSDLTPTGQHKPVTSLGMSLSRIGGAAFGFQDSVSDRKLIQNQGVGEWQWVSATGLNNTGLLVTTWGKVIATSYSQANGLHWFHIDDGSGLSSDFNEHGVIVYSDADVKQGQFVSVTGVSSIEAGIDDPTHLIRTIRPGRSEDVQVQNDAVPEYPFSDEFNGGRIDTHWGQVSYVPQCGDPSPSTIGTISVGSGELKIDIPVGSTETGSPYSKQIVQTVEGDWDMEVKLRIVPTLGKDVFQCIGIALKYVPTDIVPMMYETYGSGWANWLAAITPQTSYDPDKITGRMHYIVVDKQVGYPDTLLNTLTKTAWFKIRKRGTTAYGSASTDGVNYTQEYSTDCLNRCYLAICGYSYSYYAAPGPFAGYCDYIRFTRVSE